MVIGIDASRANVAQRTGTERYAFEVITRLIKLWPEHQLRLYVREPLRRDWGPLPPHVEIRVLTWAPGLLWSHIRLSWEMIWHRPDVLFVPADTVPLIHPNQTVTTIHDIAFEKFPELYRGKSVQRALPKLRPVIHAIVRLLTLGRYGASERDYHRWSVRQAIRSSYRLLTVSEFSRHEIIQTLGVPATQVIVTPLGIRQPEYFSALSKEQATETCRRLGMTDPFFLYVGRLEKKKGILNLLRAYRQLQRESTNAPDLVLVGNPGFGWEEALSEFGPTPWPHIHQLGWLDDVQLDALYVEATAFLFLSEYEGFGIPPAESLSAGTPVIAANRGSLPEVLGRGAVFVEPQDVSMVTTAMHSLIGDNALRNQLIRDGRHHIRRFTWDETARLTAQAIIG